VSVQSSFRYPATLAFAALFLGWFADVYAAADTNPRLEQFAAVKSRQMEELAGKLHLDVPAEARAFFKAAEAGDYVSVSNAYAHIQQLTGPFGGSTSVTGYKNALNVPIHETWGAYEFYSWDPALLNRYAEGILGSIPANSVYLGGTDPGRFIITMFCDTTNAPISVLTPKFVVTQNALVETRYMDYLRLTQGDRLWLPSTNDMHNALQDYAASLQERQRRGEQLSPDEQVDGAGHIRGVLAVMNANGLLTRMIFNRNKEKHPFFVEESYVIGWMYPYMEPHGLILKLNNEPLASLDRHVVNDDTRYWDALSGELLADRHFTDNIAARKTYSKLRSAIGGLYMYRRMTDNAEAAYKQALNLCPTSPEANFRLAQLYLEGSRFDDALAVMERLEGQLNPGTEQEKVSQAIRQIQEMKRKTAERQTP